MSECGWQSFKDEREWLIVPTTDTAAVAAVDPNLFNLAMGKKLQSI